MEECECIVCFWNYDDEERRPRFMPCGHTMCSKCLEDAIRKNSKMCPKCRTQFQASNIKELPVNFSLESLVKMINVSKKTDLSENKRSCEDEKLPECIEHQLPVSRRCVTHKSWVCRSCLGEEHSIESCRIISISTELNFKKTRQFNQSQSSLDVFEEACKTAEDCKMQLKKEIDDNDKEILSHEIRAKRLQEAIQQKKNSKKQMIDNYDKFDQKIETIKSKKDSYDQAVISLKASKTIRGVSSTSVEVQHEANKLQLISTEIKNEVKQIVKSFEATAETNIAFFLGNHKISVRDGKSHLHSFQGDNTPVSPSYDFRFTDIDAPSMTDGIITFMDFNMPGQKIRTVYMKMKGNSTRAKQHLLLVTGHCGHSYKGLHFYPPCKSGQPGEIIILHPYDGKNAMPLLKNQRKNDIGHKSIAGLVHGAAWGTDPDTALLAFTLIPYTLRTESTGFGIVTSGLEILQEIAKSDVREQIKVVDCGIVLFW